MAPDPEDWLTRREAAAYARVSLTKLDRARRNGHLQSNKPDSTRTRRFRRRWVDRWLEAGGLSMLAPFLWSAMLLSLAAVLVCTCMLNTPADACPFK